MNFCTKNLLRFLVVAFCIFFSKEGFSQATLKVMQYNLLYYGENTSYCDQTNNNISNKDGYLETILNYVEPDVITVNEIASNISVITNLLNNVIKANGRTDFGKGPYTNYAGSNIVNMIFYDTKKLTLTGYDVIQHSLRDMNVYEFYYNSPDISQNDTVYLTFIVAHLKAGSYSSDEDERAEMTQLIVDYVEAYGEARNILVMGDFNTYSSSEQTIQKLVYNSNSNYKFHDPIDKLGNWSSNSYYADYHTQSTHTTTDCHAGGGMDDRFDFIMISNAIENNQLKIRYVDNSYEAFGQDGNRYNQTIISPTNTAVPSNVATALSGMSDHLPVLLELNINQTPVAGISSFNADFGITYNNPVEDYCEMYITSDKSHDYEITVYNGVGQLVETFGVAAVQVYQDIRIDFSSYQKGIYYIRISNSHFQITEKIVRI